MYNELKGRKPVEWPHRQVARATVMDSKLRAEISKGKEGVAGIKTFLVLTVAVLYLAVVP